MSLYESATDNERATLHAALDALKHAAGFMSAIDVSNAEANLSNVRYRPLTEATISAAQDLDRLFPMPTGAGFIATNDDDLVGEVVPR